MRCARSLLTVTIVGLALGAVADEGEVQIQSYRFVRSSR
jgi:hypothetical protein